MNFGVQSPPVYLITPGGLTADNFYTRMPELVGMLRSAAADGVTLIQIREKRLPARMLFELSQAAVETANEYKARILVNERFDIAMAAGAAGVHLPAAAIPSARLREKVGRDFVIGISTHSIEEIYAARDGGADFVVFGPVFDTPGKGPAAGLSALGAACTAAGDMPVYALGGIGGSNAAEALCVGAAGVAAIRSLIEAGCRRELLAAVRAARSES